MFSIITGGVEWRFHYSQTGGEFSQMCFKVLNSLREPVSPPLSTMQSAILPMNRQNSARSWSAAAPCRFGKSTTRESGRGLPHSKTLTRHRMFMGAMRANIRGSLIMSQIGAPGEGTRPTGGGFVGV